ncbi:MAG TPA: hypothetical protein VK897_17530 [Anaerolineales bacterium]|nr:hypothetical protein [Anaerolineales bacterium]
MKSLKFSEFYKGKFADEGYELYFVKDMKEKPIYIGISRDSIWHRWFGGGPSHMGIKASGKLYGKSYLGEVIARRLPSSWDWIIELWTKEDCLDVCKTEFLGRDRNKIEIESIEPYMIIKFEPLYNVMHGGGRHEDPTTTENLDTIYKDLFG